MYYCPNCAYTSERSFNVNRHFDRIHKKMDKPRTCCGKVYQYKDKYYKHCERRHPNSRVSCKMSRQKYKISHKKSRKNSETVLNPLTERFLEDNFQSLSNEDFDYEETTPQGDFTPPTDDESSNDKENLPNEYLNFLQKFDFDGMKVAVEYNEY